ncbi:MAG: inositol monophosphatase family protein, partial [Pseudomonadota bacterium]
MKNEKSQTQLEIILSNAAEHALRWSKDRSKLIVDEKSAGQFVSNADLEIEGQLRNELLENFGDTPIIGEEMGGDLAADLTGWAIDPIDGTSNFLLGLPTWGISVGFLEQRKSVLGAIALPDLGLVLSAAEGRGIRLNRSPLQNPTKVPSVRVIALGENDYESGRQSDS